MTDRRDREAWAGSTRAADLPGDWHTRRARVLRRDPVCMFCHAAPSVEVDHIGDRTDHRLEMLRGACASCHLKRTLAQAATARAARPGRLRPRERHPGILPDVTEGGG